MNQRKSLNELTLLDRFLFAEAMEQPENMQTLLEIILGKEVVLKHLPQTEHEKRKSPLYRFVKLDVWTQDTEGTLYDTEVQKKDTKNLPKRSRYYQGVIDSKLLEPGLVDFNQLNELFIIIITPFDLFGEEKYCYTFRMKCEEIPELHLNDGITRIFLNTHGTNDDEVSDDLIELLHLMEYTNDNQTRYKNENLQKMLKRVRDIQNNAEVSVKYMQEWEERILERQEAKEEGKLEGKLEGRREAVQIFIEIALRQHMKDESILKILQEDYMLESKKAREYVENKKKQMKQKS